MNRTYSLVTVLAVVGVSIVFGMILGGKLNAPDVALAAARASTLSIDDGSLRARIAAGNGDAGAAPRATDVRVELCLPPLGAPRGHPVAVAGQSGQQVLGSIIGFGLIYLSLLAAWLFVLDLKIRHGPEPAAARPPPDERGVLDAAARRSAWTSAGWNPGRRH